MNCKHLVNIASQKSCEKLLDLLLDNNDWYYHIIFYDKTIKFGVYPLLDKTIQNILADLNYECFSDIYLCYYPNGEFYQPRSRFPDKRALTIVLGAKRTFVFGKQNFSTSQGDVYIFDHNHYQILENKGVTKPHITITVFVYNKRKMIL